jgi:hypothetical protein
MVGFTRKTSHITIFNVKRYVRVFLIVGAAVWFDERIELGDIRTRRC